MQTIPTALFLPYSPFLGQYFENDLSTMGPGTLDMKVVEPVNEGADNFIKRSFPTTGRVQKAPSIYLQVRLHLVPNGKLVQKERFRWAG